MSAINSSTVIFRKTEFGKILTSNVENAIDYWFLIPEKINFENLPEKSPQIQWGFAENYDYVKILWNVWNKNGRSLACLAGFWRQNKLQTTLQKILQFIPKMSTFFLSLGHPKQKPRSRKQRETSEHRYIYIWLWTPLFPPKPQETKSPNTGTHWKTVLHHRVTDTHPKNTEIYTRKEHLEWPRTLSADLVRGPGHPPQHTRARKRSVKTNIDFALFVSGVNKGERSRFDVGPQGPSRPPLWAGTS